MSAFVMLAILMTSTMGCIGLVPAREFMEDLRPAPEMIEVVEKINASHVFTTDVADVAGSTSYSSVQNEVDSDVVETGAYISAAMPLELILPSTNRCKVRQSISNRFRGNQVWFEEVTETERKMVATFSQPLAEGSWTLSVDAEWRRICKPLQGLIPGINQNRAKVLGVSKRSWMCLRLD